MTNIYLVRHGQASAGTDNYDRLSTLGIKQAKLLGEYWKQGDFNVPVAFSGSLERQQHTANLALDSLADQPEVNTLEALNEYDHHIVDELFGGGLTSDSGMNLRFDQYLDIMQRWRDATLTQSDIDAGATSWESFSERGWQGVRSAVASSDAKTLVFFTSGGVIATILQKVMGLGFESTMHAIWQTRNASITRLYIDKASASSNNACVVDYNSIPHLQLHHDKTLITQI